MFFKMDAQENNVEDEKKPGKVMAASRAASKAIVGVVKKKPLVALTDFLDVAPEMRDDFQKRIIDLTQTTARVMKREVIPIWVKTAYDENPIHSDKEVAAASKIVKFTDTPIHGTRQTAHGDFYAAKVLAEINLVSPVPLTYVSKVVKFRDPLYPDETLLWNISRANKSEKGLELTVIGSTEKGKTVVEFPTLILNSNRKELSWEDLYAHDFGSFKANWKNITHENLQDYGFCLGLKELSKMAMAHAELLAPALLLELSLEKTGLYSGVYRGIEFTYYNEPTLGEFKTSVRNLSEPKGKPGNFIYNFGVLCGQKDKPIFSAKVKPISPEKLD